MPYNEIEVCGNCGFVENDDDEFYESGDTLYRLNDDAEEEAYDVFCLECPKCGHKQSYAYD